MNIFALVVATACGALVATVGRLVSSALKNRPFNRLIGTSAAVVLFAVLYVGAKSTIIPSLTVKAELAQFESLIEQNPAFESMQEFAPEVITELRNYLKVAVREKQNTQTVETTTREIVGRVIGDRLPNASNAAILNSIQLNVEQLSSLEQRADNSCFKYLFPHVDGGIEALVVFSQELLDRDYDSTRLILSTYDANRPAPAEGRAKEILNPIYVELFQIYGQDILAELQNVTADDVDKPRLCVFMIDLYKRILEKEEQDAVTALRWMLQ